VAARTRLLMDELYAKTGLICVLDNKNIMEINRLDEILNIIRKHGNTADIRPLFLGQNPFDAFFMLSWPSSSSALRTR
jgi:hypothetical protein